MFFLSWVNTSDRKIIPPRYISLFPRNVEENAMDIIYWISIHHVQSIARTSFMLWTILWTILYIYYICMLFIYPHMLSHSSTDTFIQIPHSNCFTYLGPALVCGFRKSLGPKSLGDPSVCQHMDETPHGILWKPRILFLSLCTFVP